MTLNFIAGLRATSATGVIGVRCGSQSISSQTYTVAVTVNSETVLSFIKINYVIFNTEQSKFASNGGYFEPQSLTVATPRYHKIHSDFAPIVYELAGFDSIVLRGKKKLHLDVAIDSDYILGFRTNYDIDEISIFFLTIGQRMNLACASCPLKVVHNRSCIAACPSGTYLYDRYTLTGKSCLTCSAKVYEKLNDAGTACVCESGYAKNEKGICTSIIITIPTGTLGSTTTTTVTNSTTTVKN